MDKDKNTLFLVDCSVLVKVFEEDDSESSVQCFKLLNEIKAKTNKMKGITTVASFLRALWRMDKDKAKPENIQLVLETVDVGFLKKNGFASFDYKNEQKIIDEIMTVANTMSSKKNEDST